MDSDDNCLVIDEGETDSRMETEVPSPKLTPTTTTIETEKPMNCTETCNDVSHQENGIINAPVPSVSMPRAETSPKQKDRSIDKSKPKDDKNKTKTPIKDKKNYSSKKAHYVRLTKAVFKDKLLNISAQNHQLYNMHFSLKGCTLIADMPDAFPLQPPFPELNLEQLLNWPGIKITVSFDHFSFAHEVKENCDRDIVIGDNPLENINMEKNLLETRYLQKVPSSKLNPMLSKGMIETYVTSLMEAARLYEVGPSKLPEIEKSFCKIVNDVNRVPHQSIQTRITHSYFFNEYKYYRIFKNDAAGKKNLKVRLRETINPEVNFWVKRCLFTSDHVSDWQNTIQTFFEDVLVKRSHNIRDLLRDRYKKCLILKCETCNESFEGALWVVKLKDHIKQKHFVDKPWTCVKCNRSWDQTELLQMDWKHNCTINK